MTLNDRRDFALSSRTGLHRLLLLVASLCTTIVADGRPASADDWPQWRGPNRDGVSTESGLLESWPAGGPPRAWQIEGIGTGYSSIVVQAGRLYTLGARAGDVIVSALDAASGKGLWTATIGTTSRHPCSTPTADGDRVYALGPDGQLTCLRTTTGEMLWQRDFFADFGGRLMSGRGYGESPLVDGDRLICTPGGEEAQIVALDKRTGEVVWTARFPHLGDAGRDGAGFSSLVVSQAAGVRQYVQLMGRGLVGVAASDGRFLWGYNRITNETANIPTPVAYDDFVFAANGYNVGSVLLRLIPDEAPFTDRPAVRVEEVFSLSGGQFQNHHGGIVRVGQLVFGGHGSNNGLPTCIDLESGRVLWKRRGPGVGSAAVVTAGDRFYFRYQDGLVALLNADSSGFEVSGTLQIPSAGGDSWAHPVVANGLLYLREQDVLHAFDVRGNQTVAPPETSRIADDASDAEHPALEEVRAVGGRWQPVARSRQSPRRRLYQFLEAPQDQPASAGFLVCTVSDDQLVDAEVTEEIIRLLESAPGPFILNLAGTAIRGSALSRLSKLPRLCGLNLELCREVGDEDLAGLVEAAELQVLVLAGTRVTAAGIEHLCDLPALVALDLEGCEGIHDGACAALARLTGLRGLVLRKTAFEKQFITDDGLAQVRSLDRLELLDLSGNRVTDAGLESVQALARLRDLDLSLLAITDAGLRHLTSLKLLQRLELIYAEGFAGPLLTDACGMSLRELESLRELNLTGAKLSDAGLEWLSSLPALRRVQLARTTVSAAGAERLRMSRPGLEVSR